jgi:hypothetical protein
MRVASDAKTRTPALETPRPCRRRGDDFAATLVLVFGQQIEHVVRLTWADVSITEELVSVTLGRTSIALPHPLDEPLRRVDAEPRQGLTAAHPATAWIFRGGSPGQHLAAAHLRNRIKTIIAVRSARLGTLHELTRLAPIAVVADVLGYSDKTIERHAIASASPTACPHLQGLLLLRVAHGEHAGRDVDRATERHVTRRAATDLHLHLDLRRRDDLVGLKPGKVDVLRVKHL